MIFKHEQITTFDITHAIQSLRPGAVWSIEGDDYSTLDWQDTEQTQPTEDEINTEIARLQAESDAKQYARDRKDNYPSIGDQLDMLYHAINNNETLKTDFADFYNAVKAIKDQYPKE